MNNSVTEALSEAQTSEEYAEHLADTEPERALIHAVLSVSLRLEALVYQLASNSSNTTE